MEIIQLYESDDGSEVCVISDGSIIYFTDKNDVAVESPTVGTVVRPSQVNEAYLEIPKELLQEVARRSEIAVEPDLEEDSDEDSEGDSEEDSEEDPPDWRPLARERFLDRFKSWMEGRNIRIILPFGVKIFHEDGELDTDPIWQSSDGFNTLEDLLRTSESFNQAMGQLRQIGAEISADYKTFVDEQNELGHELTINVIDDFIYQEATVQRAAAE